MRHPVNEKIGIQLAKVCPVRLKCVNFDVGMSRFCDNGIQRGMAADIYKHVRFYRIKQAAKVLYLVILV